MIRNRRARRVSAVLVALAATAATASAFTTAQAQDHPASASSAPSGVERHDPAPQKGQVDHDLDGPFSKQQSKQREAALQQVISGDAKVEKRGGSKVVKLDDKKYVELGREKTDKIFTILVEFGDDVDSTTTYDPDGADGPLPPVVKYGGDRGPLHNEIAEPDRKVDNSTAWQADYSQEHFQDLYFGTGKDAKGKAKDSLKTYYEKTSSGRYSVDGEVSDWVKVPWNEARYGSNYCGSTNCANVWDLVRDGLTAWTADQKAQGRTDAQIKDELSQYDQWDRYDFDNDGDFNEPDGYVDHFQIVHAGEDESAGGGVQGTDALWAHRWYAYGTNAGSTGPTGNKAGGAPVGDTGIWVGDYTMQPENGGLGVFAHEYGHDLGLPDLYDTAGGDNSTAFWTLMSSGSWLGTGKNEIGDLPGDMTAWDKLQLGWLDYAEAKAATNSTHKLGVSAYNTKNPQALVVELPEKEKTTTVVKPAEGSKQWWSDMGDDLKNTLTRSVDLTGRTAASLDLTGWWDIEADYDYLYTEVSTDGGANWTPLDGTADGKSLPRDAADKPALTGVSGAAKKLAFPLDAYAGQKFDLRFRYQTDGGVSGKGFTADAITLTADGAPVFTDNAEGDDAGWTANGFSRIGESFTQDYEQYYIAENRQYVSYDRTLKVGPYNFGFTAPNDGKVEHFAYQNGLLIWLWDTSQKDNNTSQHPGEGLILPIDAHAKPLKWSDGTLMRNRIQAYDSTFSWWPTSGLSLHRADKLTRISPSLGAPVFDDRKGTYWSEENKGGSVKVPDTNTKISIISQPLDGSTMTVKVGKSGK
ncbi:immune inhibitor A domain-containing protein [Streptomyces sp. NPDC059092]|uniref:immune inhibitor A domain-containing protein n=1 Tax=Streptomyces sp. NPDC059092 TaxID=3346725 RepID=UPI00367E5465